MKTPRSSANGSGVRPGPPSRPRPPGSHPCPGLLNETTLEGKLLRGLLGVRSTRQGMRHPVGGSYLLWLALLGLVSLLVDRRSTGYQPKVLAFGCQAEGRHLRCLAKAMSLHADPTASSNQTRRVSQNSASLVASGVIDLEQAPSSNPRMH